MPHCSKTSTMSPSRMMGCFFMKASVFGSIATSIRVTSLPSMSDVEELPDQRILGLRLNVSRVGKRARVLW